ncbi:MAG: 30S ribosomal protein S1 [Deltaproteobacteria bacterium]|nr:30S ribosomal protein S1 [Deltaproteobacteria bacterium]
MDTHKTEELREGGQTFAEMFEESLARQDAVKEGEIVKGRVLEVTPDFVLVDIGYKSEATVSAHEFMSVEGKPSVAVGDVIDLYVESREDDTGIIIVSKEKADKLRVWDDISAAAERDELIDGVVVARVKGGLSVDIGVKAFLPGSQVDLRPIRNLDKLIGQRFKFKVIKFNKKRGNIVLSRRVLLEQEREAQKSETLKKLAEGEIMTGQVKNLTDYGAFVDLGGIDGLLHITDMSWGRINHPSEMFNIGDEIKVKVLKFDKDTERVSLGYKQITEDPWSAAADKYPVSKQVRGKVVSLTDYGAFVELEPGVEGLVHVSEMSWTKRVKHPSKLVSVGDEVNAMVLDIDVPQKRISLGMKQCEPNPWTQLADKYPVGAVIKGTVRNITDFGIFVGVEEGIDGLVHVSDLSWTHRVKHPSELYNKGDEVEAVVLNIDVENERFSLGVKQLTDDPWETLPRRFPRGTKVKGKVMKVTDYGVFVEIEPGIDGLCHVSELSEERVDKPGDMQKTGDEVEVMVLDVDPGERRISLSIKAAREGTSDYRAYMGDEGQGRAHFGEVFGEKLAAAVKDEKRKG